MDSDELRKRTKKFALRIIKLADSLPRNRIGDVFGRQILKAGTSVGANYREALRASSKRHFISILEISLREADETNQLIAILAATIRTAKKRSKSPKSEI